MKYFVLFALAISVVSSTREIETNILHTLQKIENVELEIPKEWIEEIFLKFNNESFSLQDGTIAAIINDYVDKLLPDVDAQIMRNGLDPIELPDATLNVLVGHIMLTGGWLQDLSTLARDGDTKASYSSSTRDLVLEIPVRFDALMFTYNYHTKVAIINIYGGVEGEVENVKCTATVSFNFGTEKVHLDNVDIRNSGKIHIRFTGNKIVDWLTNAMSSVVSLFLHPVILRIVNNLIQNPLDKLVDALNETIYNILHP